ncbi:MAG: hypothetical protein MI806_15260 [Minwuiales bacterium]|nr:hypothetical protein [Minwuiales bacterium]
MQQTGPVDQEALLAEFAGQVCKNPEGYHAVHLPLSRLKAQNRRDHHIRIAANSLEPLVDRANGALFVLSNKDIVAAFRDVTVSEVDEVVVKLRFLFSEDPLASEADSEGDTGFCTWYDLSWQHGAFSRLASELRNRANLRPDGLPGDMPKGHQPEANEPLTPERLSRLESHIQSADLSPFIRRQSVCAISRDGTPTPVFRELFVSINELRKTMLPTVDLASDRWLFQRLTKILDQRLMRVLPEMDIDLSIATSINVNVSTLLSPAFLKFDRRMRSITEMTFVLELQPIDIFGDMGAYMFARDFVRNRGYRVCMDSLNHLTFPLVDRRQFGFDFEKVLWSADGDFNERRRDALASTVKASGTARVIMAHCDSQNALEFGQSIGINLFQGWHIDHLISQPAGGEALTTH